MPKNRSDAASGGFTSAFRVSEWSVRRKIVAVLAVPVTLATVFGGLRVSSELTDASNYSTTNQRAQVVGPALAYLGAVERLAMPPSLADAMKLGGEGTPTQEYSRAEAALKQAQGSSHLTRQQSGLVSGMLRVGEQLRTGSGAGIDATPSVQLTNLGRLTTGVVESTLNGNGTSNPHVQALTQAINAKLSLAKQQLLIANIHEQSSLLGSVWLAAEIGVEGAALDNLKATYGSPRRVASLIAANGTRLGEATNSKAGSLSGAPWMFMNYDIVSQQLRGLIDAQVAAQASAAKNRALTDSGIILLALLASLMLALVMSRMIINPLRRVRAGALDVANNQLPETVARIRQGREPEEMTPIPVHSHEDLGQLARAVDDMHRQAVTLATGEAQLRAQVGAMFVTLSRRNTTLVNQQLALIESLEQDEEDPARLEQLFSLDHLATRMRRTAESLVILGGNQGRTAGVEELSVSDVIHAAVSEVQDYQRVRIDAVPDRMIAARAASDVVHLMAELIDNALSYSPPGTPVTIQAAEDDGRVDIEVIDSGLGMAGDQLAEANESLKRGGQVTVDTARRMGLFVVSRLAEQHGLRVKLRRNVNGGGIIAAITLPADVLVSDEPVLHTSLLDAPAEEPEEPTAPVLEEDVPDEEYDPYLERIEEAIAAVTGLPRRRPGLNTHEPEPATPAASAASVSMFDPAPNPELPAAYEPTPLPSLEDTNPPSGSEGNEPIPLPAALHVAEEDEGEETLAPVVMADFGASGRSDDEEFEFELDVAPEQGLADEPVVERAAPSAWARATAEWARQAEEAAHAPGSESETEVETAAESAAESASVEALETEHDDEGEAPAWTDAPAPAAQYEPAAEDEPAEEGAEYDDAEHSYAESSYDAEPSYAEPFYPEPSYLEPSYDAEPSYPEPSYPEPSYPEPAYADATGELPAEPPAEVHDEPWAPVAQADTRYSAESVDPVDEPDLPVRLTIRRPLDATAAAAALDGDLPVHGTTESPIFGHLQSNWLTDEPEQQWTNNEVDRGWNAAERADSVDAEDRTRTGLPVRRPGGRLVPGGVSQESEPITRDPEAIRNRLAAHAAGVSRGRAAAASKPMTDDYAHEETGPA